MPQIEGSAKPGFDLQNPQVLLAWQRNHLANERTFLAWCRTGIALFAFSFVIERFDFFIRQIQHLSGFEEIQKRHIHTEVITLSTFAIGMLVISLAAWRYFNVRKAINQGEAHFSPTPDVVLSLAMLAMMLGLFVVLVLVIAN